jgi:hypothetical protein
MINSQQPGAHMHELADSLGFCAFFDEVKHPEYHFLSNFYESPISSSLGDFKCSEGLYQYQKFMHINDPDIKKMFQKADGQTAYILSRKLASKVVKSWDRIIAMKLTLRAKFKDPILNKKLLSTRDAYLVENSHRGHDLFWADYGDGTGENRMGMLLMELRKENGGIGVVAIPHSLNFFYSAKCSKCDAPPYFKNSGYLDHLCPLHKGMTSELRDALGKLDAEAKALDKIELRDKVVR